MKHGSHDGSDGSIRQSVFLSVHYINIIRAELQYRAANILLPTFRTEHVVYFCGENQVL